MSWIVRNFIRQLSVSQITHGFNILPPERSALEQRFSTFVTLWTPQKFQARVADPTAQGALSSTFRTPGWARTCLIKMRTQTT